MRYASQPMTSFINVHAIGKHLLPKIVLYYTFTYIYIFIIYIQHRVYLKAEKDKYRVA